MILRLMIVGIYLLHKTAQAYDSESSEGNRIEGSPFYDTIIFSDIADVINDFENNNSPFETPSSNSESDENIEDLLSEYQHYLDRAHKQRLDYFEKTKTKSKIPLFRHDRYSKNVKPLDSRGKYDNFYYTNSYYVPTPYKLSQQSHDNPLDLLIPLRPKDRYMTKFGPTTPLPGVSNNGVINNFNEAFEKKMIDLPPVVRKTTHVPPKSSCHCKYNQIPCDCSCKQCVITLDNFSEGQITRKAKSFYDEKKGFIQNVLSDKVSNNAEYSPDNRNKNTLENLNVRIKVDIQIPKQGSFGRVFNDPQTDSDDGNLREITSMVNLPYLNFPFPMDMFDYKKSSNFIKHDTTPLHKITIRKKKKPRVSNSNKKHKKKFITFHNIKVEPRQYFPSNIVENYNISKNQSNKLDNLIPLMNANETPITMLHQSNCANETHKDENIDLMVNITAIKVHNTTEDEHKTGNSIESDYPKFSINITTTEKAIRVRRNILNKSSTTEEEGKEKYNEFLLKDAKAIKTKDTKFLKKGDKQLLIDSELMYWPRSEPNRTDSLMKNITYRIIENETKKSKLNMSKETILKNHTGVLEQAIFGKADWDDIDTVVPEFMSFIGKYLRGVLTFCSQSVCHSMKCAEKTCIHRICIPKERLNNKGHCSGSNTTDSIASMESIMDLPSNIAFEIVDILQERMSGKLYGKMTLCINTKCITFATSKKVFVKSKCNIKELNAIGQCPSMEVKLL